MACPRAVRWGGRYFARSADTTCPERSVVVRPGNGSPVAADPVVERDRPERSSHRDVIGVDAERARFEILLELLVEGEGALQQRGERRRRATALLGEDRVACLLAIEDEYQRVTALLRAAIRLADGGPQPRHGTFPSGVVDLADEPLELRRIHRSFQLQLAHGDHFPGPGPGRLREHGKKR